MGLITRVLKNLEERRQKILDGGINCIPSPFKAFEEDFPGVEQAMYYLVSGGSKAAKTQITNYLFLYIPILYAYYHPEQLRVRIFYCPLEETPEKITIRFMCYLLYTLSDMKIRVSSKDLGSINKEHIVDKKVLEILNSMEYRSILDFFEDRVVFLSEKNPTGVWKEINKYALNNGKIHRKSKIIENKDGSKQVIEAFDYYEPEDPDEYVIIIVDHASLLGQERGMSLKECIDKLSEYFKDIRNNFHYTPVLIQQQNVETIGLEAFKTNRIRPTQAGLADSKNPGKDCSLMLGITNPHAFDRTEYCNYNILRLRSFVRFLEVTLNREGVSNGIIALYFDGATNFFTPLPKLNELDKLQKVYQLVDKYDPR